ncbi:hypothetical protein NDU88_002456 [Pleurodeles waltl]|uniref:Uncharacterized protein n=1 Tax=Pleurodeles waltl TaxID=8319 RepID=A0AAV7MST5_PLEWA|nr:hypothetical protein NDU88_002456 [Pleurodeles waltl]
MWQSCGRAGPTGTDSPQQALKPTTRPPSDRSGHPLDQRLTSSPKAGPACLRPQDGAAQQHEQPNQQPLFRLPPSARLWAAGHRFQAPRCPRQTPQPEADSAIQAARPVGPALPASAVAPCPGGRSPLAHLKAPQAPLHSQRSNSNPGALFQQAPAAEPLRHLSRAPQRVRACRSPGPGRPRILMGPASHRSAPPQGAGVRDRHDLGCRSNSAFQPTGRRRPPSPHMPLDKLGRTRSSLSKRPPLSPAWPLPPCKLFTLVLILKGHTPTEEYVSVQKRPRKTAFCFTY